LTGSGRTKRNMFSANGSKNLIQRKVCFGKSMKGSATD